MKAALRTKFGPADEMRVVDIPRPAAKENVVVSRFIRRF